MAKLWGSSCTASELRRNGMEFEERRDLLAGGGVEGGSHALRLRLDIVVGARLLERKSNKGESRGDRIKEITMTNDHHSNGQG